jgi:hypothetical protein
MKPFISQKASKIRKKRLKYTTLAGIAGLPIITGISEGVYNTFNNWRNNSDETTFDDVKND